MMAEASFVSEFIIHYNSSTTTSDDWIINDSSNTNVRFETISPPQLWEWAFGCKDHDDYLDLIQRLRLADYRKDKVCLATLHSNPFHSLLSNHAKQGFHNRIPVNRNWQGKQVRSR